MSYYPRKLEPRSLLTTALSQEVAVNEAVLIANRLPNVYLDSSVFIAPKHYKTELLLYHTAKAAFGSDWPYCMKTPYGRLSKAEKLATRFIGQDGVQKIHERALYFLETDIKEFFKTSNDEEELIADEYIGKDEDYMKKAFG
jgi:hypothetical protein